MIVRFIRYIGNNAVVEWYDDGDEKLKRCLLPGLLINDNNRAAESMYAIDDIELKRGIPFGEDWEVRFRYVLNQSLGKLHELDAQLKNSGIWTFDDFSDPNASVRFDGIILQFLRLNRFALQEYTPEVKPSEDNPLIKKSPADKK